MVDWGVVCLLTAYCGPNSPLVWAMEFRKSIFQAWKVMDNSKGHGKVMENEDNVMKFLLLH